MRLKTYHKIAALLENISEAQRGKGMMREATDFLARALAAEGDTQSAQAVKRAFITAAIGSGPLASGHTPGTRQVALFYRHLDGGFTRS